MPNHWFQTFTGKQVDLENPTPDIIDIVDIAHALSMICRYNGHCRDFYSVAEHSANVEKLAYFSGVSTSAQDWDRRAMAFLLHDAPEAYLQDIMTPLKRLLFPKYEELETRWQIAIETKFDLGNLLTNPEPLVKDCDRRALSVEVVNLFSPPIPDWWKHFGEPTQVDLHDMPVECLSPTQARLRFLGRFRQLQRGLIRS
jgi:hypothetical protein